MEADMYAPDHIEIVEDRVVFRLTGTVSIDRAMEMVTAAIDYACSHRIRNLMVNASNLTGFKPPSVIDRYFFVHDFARAAAGVVRLALVIGPEMIDARKFGSTVAANVGFVADIFTTEEDALIWLRRIK